MQEMLQRAGTRKQKRQAPGRGSRSPPDSAPPAAKRAAAAAPAGAGTTPAAVELSAAALTAIQRLIDAGNAKVISAFEAKVDILERRVSILEGDCMDKEAEILRLNQRLQHQEKAMEDLYQ